jgi:hypothetical protein
MMCASKSSIVKRVCVCYVGYLNANYFLLFLFPVLVNEISSDVVRAIVKDSPSMQKASITSPSYASRCQSSYDSFSKVRRIGWL